MLTCIYLAIVVYAPALALAQVTGMDMNLSIGITFLVCIFYTALGGIKAVIWTNVFQAFCMITACLVVVIVGKCSHFEMSIFIVHSMYYFKNQCGDYVKNCILK